MSRLVWVRAPAYAPASVGPFEPGIEGLPEVNVVLRRGFTAQLRIVDGSEKPLEGATVTAEVAVPPDPSHLPFGEFTSDRDGVVLLEHCPEFPMRLDASSAGYATDRKAGSRGRGQRQAGCPGYRNRT